MTDIVERRQDPRAPISLPVEVKTPKGTVNGKTANISVGGLALLLFRESPSVGDQFSIILSLPDHHETEFTCKKRWSGEMIADKTVYTAIGVQFTKISNKDRKIIASLVKEHCFS